jgi:3-phenylpropionate/trans-cinnamate dioxygenase ferredoxin subunit
MAEYVKVAAKTDIPRGSFKAYRIGFDRLVIAHTADGFYAFADECTHDSEPFGHGVLDNNDIVCARHGARFDVRTGEVTAPPALVPLDTYELKIDGEDILVLLD